MSSAVIGPEGGSFSYRAGAGRGWVRVDVPSGALDRAVPLTISRSHERALGSVGEFYELGPSGTEFAEPVTVALGVAARELPVVDRALRLVTSEDGEWLALPAAGTDSEVVAGYAGHFSPFGAVIDGDPDPAYLYHRYGTVFTVGDVTLRSSTEIQLHSMMVRPNRIDYLIQSDAAGSAEFTLEGLRPSAELFLYEDTARNEVVLQVSPSGVASYEQPLTGDVQGIWVQPTSGTLFIDATHPEGGDCEIEVDGNMLGWWSSSTKTCQLLQDAPPVPIEISSSGTKLDCKDPNTSVNHSVTEVMVAGGTSGVTVTNCTFTSPLIGLHVNTGASDVGIFDNTFEDVSQDPRAFAITFFGAGVGAQAYRNHFEAPYGIFVRDTESVVLRESTFDVERGIELHGTLTTLNSIALNDFAIHAGPGAPTAIRVEDGASNNVIGQNTLEGPLLSAGTPPQGLAAGFGVYVDGAATTGLDIRKNQISGFHAGLSLGGDPLGFSGGGGYVMANGMTGNEFGILLYTGTYQFDKNDIYNNSRRQLSVTTVGQPGLTAPLELSVSPDGNYWGRPCPGPPLFIAGTDTNDILAVDSHPWGAPITTDSIFPAQDFLDAGVPGCGILDTDGDGFTPNEGDCDDRKVHCTADCTDPDNDGWCGAEDCDNADPLNFPYNPEVCDGSDNNCNGQVDEGFPDVGQPCTAHGVCGDGFYECVAGGQRCSSEASATPEACHPVDGLDNDCDGEVDNPVACPGSADCGPGEIECAPWGGGTKGVCSTDPGGSLYERGTCALTLDSDNDGLLDVDEALGIDVNGDGVPEVDLPAYGADPSVPDIFVEVDYMEGFAPDPVILQMVVDAFWARGIVLHLDVGTAAPGTAMDLGGGNQIPYADIISFLHSADDCPPGEWDCIPGGSSGGLTFLAFDIAKADNFDPDRMSAFHYAIYADATGAAATTLAVATQAGDTTVEVDDNIAPFPDAFVAEIDGDRFTFTGVEPAGPNTFRFIGVPATDDDAVGQHQAGVRVSSPKHVVSGMGEVFGDDFFITNLSGLTPKAQAGVFMHELGHNLGLLHGGFDGHNNKPNYLSIMNYSFQGGVPQFDPLGLPSSCVELSRRLDYSDELLPALDETNLVEADGIQNGEDDTRYYCDAYPGVQLCGQGDQPIDWNCDGDSGLEDDVCGQAGLPACDVNGDALSGAVTFLMGRDDWSTLQLRYQESPYYGNLEHGPMPDNDPEDPYDVAHIEEELSRASSVVRIDVRPGSDENPVNLRSRGVIPVAVLGTSGFDPASEVASSSVTLGRSGTEAAATHCGAEDVNADGRADLVCHFRTRDTGLTAADTTLTLYAQTASGGHVAGMDHVRIVPGH